MTRRVLGLSAIALGMAAFVSSAPLYAAYADTSAPAAQNAAPSLSEPAPTPGWAEGGPAQAASGAVPSHHRARAYARHEWRSAHRHGYNRYGYSSDNPVGEAATGVVGGVADLGSVAAYPFYCFPNYGSCHVRLPYRP
ncbi:hypothetical protein [Roseiarcus sp.]|uniref:hypothetical protein n=1 Tax=Roseiarcus sp. TaxID=1969460 RepID=UPI003F9D80F2